MTAITPPINAEFARREVYAWAMDMLRDSARQRDFAMGALEVLAGSFREEECGLAGSDQESDGCEGGREAILRLKQAERSEPAGLGRIRHGTPAR